MSDEAGAAGTPAGWYDDGSGRQRYWDGSVWTEHFADGYTPASVKVAKATGSGGPRALWSGWTTRERWVAMGSVAGTAVGILGLILPLALAPQAASVETVGVESYLGDVPTLEPIAAELSARAAGLEAGSYAYPTVAIPVDAPWEELFGLHICERDANWNETPRAIADWAAAEAWLERYGEPTSPPYLGGAISNTAGAGTITVSEIRPQGTLTPAPDRVWVSMGVCGGVGDCSEAINAKIALGVDPVAVFGDPPFWDYCGGGTVSDIVGQPGDPVVFDIAPGQYRPIQVAWTQTDDFVGRIVATVTSNGERGLIDLSPDNVDITSLAVNNPATLLLAGYGEYTFGCDPDGNGGEHADPNNTVKFCTLDEWLTMIGRR